MKESNLKNHVLLTSNPHFAVGEEGWRAMMDTVALMKTFGRQGQVATLFFSL